jgi:hypothetical protein
MRHGERLEIRQLATEHGARLDDVLRPEILADEHGEDAVLDWLRNDLPTPGLDVPMRADSLAAG